MLVCTAAWRVMHPQHSAWAQPHLILMGDIPLDVFLVDEVGGDALYLVYVQIKALPLQGLLEQTCDAGLYSSQPVLLIFGQSARLHHPLSYAHGPPDCGVGVCCCSSRRLEICYARPGDMTP
jgi:hypothetical protein